MYSVKRSLKPICFLFISSLMASLTVIKKIDKSLLFFLKLLKVLFVEKAIPIEMYLIASYYIPEILYEKKMKSGMY